MPETDPWAAQINSVGAFIRRQRNLANLSLRDLADLASVSNAYLSQIERGLHEPSVRVLRSVALALNVSAETLLAQAGLLDHVDAGAGSKTATRASSPGTEAAIRADPRLTDAQKEALQAVYESFLAGAQGAADRSTRPARRPRPGRRAQAAAPGVEATLPTQATQASRAPRPKRKESS